MLLLLKTKLFSFGNVNELVDKTLIGNIVCLYSLKPYVVVKKVVLLKYDKKTCFTETDLCERLVMVQMKWLDRRGSLSKFYPGAPRYNFQLDQRAFKPTS